MACSFWNVIGVFLLIADKLIVLVHHDGQHLDGLQGGGELQKNVVLIIVGVLGVAKIRLVGDSQGRMHVVVEEIHEGFKVAIPILVAELDRIEKVLHDKQRLDDLVHLLFDCGHRLGTDVIESLRLVIEDNLFDFSLQRVLQVQFVK